MSEPPININDLVGKYIKGRDKKAALKAEFEEKTAKLDAAMKMAEAAILKFFEDNGMDSASCEGGTAYKTTKTSATVADWDATLTWIKTQEAWHMLERRVSKTAVEEYIQSEGDLPPGVNWSSITAVNIRRS